MRIKLFGDQDLEYGDGKRWKLPANRELEVIRVRESSWGKQYTVRAPDGTELPIMEEEIECVC